MLKKKKTKIKQHTQCNYLKNVFVAECKRSRLDGDNNMVGSFWLTISLWETLSTLTVQQASVIQTFVLRPVASEQCSIFRLQQYMDMVVSDFPLLGQPDSCLKFLWPDICQERITPSWANMAPILPLVPLRPGWWACLNGQREWWWDVWFKF